MKRLAISIFAGLVVVLAMPAAAQQLTFHYGFIGQHDDQELYVVENGAAVASGTQLKLNFEYPTGSWFYLCYLSSTDDYALLYASATGVDASEATTFDTLGWLALDQNVGTETFTLITSEARLESFEALLDNYAKASGKSRKRFAKRIARALQDLAGQLAGPSGVQLAQRLDKPVMGGVAFRGVTSENLSQHSLSHKASGDRIAQAVFTIDHQ
jgi:hypothetical protein